MRDLVGLAALVIGGLVALIVSLRALQVWVRRSQEGQPESGRGDWENALAGYKNLRDEGVLSEEEYRKISTLVEPHLRHDKAEPHAAPRPSSSVAGE